MAAVKPKIRIEFEKSISPTNPKDLLKQKLIMNDMGFYHRALSLKVTESFSSDELLDSDVIIIRYGLDGERQIDIGLVNPTISQRVRAIAESVFPSNYKNAKS